MRGKKPKERKCYILRMGGGTLVEVTREVYLEWYQSRRRERYQQEQKQKYGVYSLEALEGEGAAVISVTDSLEENAIKKMCEDKLREVMDGLPQEDAHLLYLLFFEELSAKEAAQICGCSRRTVENRRKRILKELNEKMREMGITGGCF